MIDIALSSGVAPYTHPLHIGTIKPLLLVEGRDDRALILRAYLESGQPCPYDVKAMEDLEPTTTGGVEQISVYLNNNKSPLRARPASSPVVVILDHEVSEGKRRNIEKALAEHPTSACFTMPRTERTEGLKDGVSGIEAYLSLTFFEAAESAIDLELIKPSNPSAASWRVGSRSGSLRVRSRTSTGCWRSATRRLTSRGSPRLFRG